MAVIFVWAVSASGAVNLRMGHHQGLNSMLDRTAKHFAKLVEEKSGGEVRVRVFPSGQLGGENEALELLQQGGIDITITSIGNQDKYLPALAALSSAYTFRDSSHAEKAMRSEFGDQVIKDIAAASNIQVLGWLFVGPRDMMFKGEPVTRLEGLKGMKMRSPEQFTWIRMFELLDARPTPVPWGEVYTAVQAGLVAGLDTPPQQALDMKFFEVTKSLSKTGHIFLFMTLNINKNKLASLTPAQQKAILDAGRDACAWSNETIIKPENARAYADLQNKGIKVVDVVDLPKWAEAVKPLRQNISERFPGAGKYSHEPGSKTAASSRHVYLSITYAHA